MPVLGISLPDSPYAYILCELQICAPQAPSHHCRLLGRSCSQRWALGLAVPHHFSLCMWPAHPQKVVKETRLQTLLILCLNTVGSDPEFARYVAGVSQAMQQKRQIQHGRRPGNPRGHWPPMDDAHRTWPFPEFFTEGWVLGVAVKPSLGSGCSPGGLCALSPQSNSKPACGSDTWSDLQGSSFWLTVGC